MSFQINIIVLHGFGSVSYLVMNYGPVVDSTGGRVVAREVH